MAEMIRLTLPRYFGRAAALVAMLSLCSLSDIYAQEPPPPQGVSRGENFSAKPPAQLFASDCTGSGCHKGPQGLGRTQGFGGLAGFLREHYTNSRESAAALANYLSKLPSGPEPREARTPRSGKPATGRAAARPEEEPAPITHHRPAAELDESAAKPEAKPETKPEPKSEARTEPKPEPKPTARERRTHQPATAAVAPPPEPEATAAPPPPPPQAPPPPAPPKPKQYDIFD